MSDRSEGESKLAKARRIGSSIYFGVLSSLLATAFTPFLPVSERWRDALLIVAILSFTITILLLRLVYRLFRRGFSKRGALALALRTRFKVLWVRSSHGMQRKRLVLVGNIGLADVAAAVQQHHGRPGVMPQAVLTDQMEKLGGSLRGKKVLGTVVATGSGAEGLSRAERVLGEVGILRNSSGDFGLSPDRVLDLPATAELRAQVIRFAMPKYNRGDVNFTLLAHVVVALAETYGTVTLEDLKWPAKVRTSYAHVYVFPIVQPSSGVFMDRLDHRSLTTQIEHAVRLGEDPVQFFVPVVAPDASRERHLARLRSLCESVSGEGKATVQLLTTLEEVRSSR